MIEYIHLICEAGDTVSNVSYKKLWKLLIDRDMRKRDLMDTANISATSVAKLSKGENIQTDILVKICKALRCDFADIMEIVSDDSYSIVNNNDGGNSHAT